MKKIFVLLACACLPALLSAQPKVTDQELTKKLQEAVAAQTPKSQNAAERAVFPLSMRVATTGVNVKYKNDIKEMATRRNCTAVLIHPHWLLASRVCEGTEPTFDYIENSTGDMDTYRVTSRYSNGFRLSVGETEYDVPVAFGNEQVFLLFVGHNYNLEAAFKKYPHAKVFIPREGNTLQDYRNMQFVINRKSIGFDSRVVGQRTLKDCYENGCVTVKNGLRDFNAYAGDPLFMRLNVTPQTQEDFLAGFNYSTVKGEKRGRSADYHDFTPKTYEFIKNTISENNPDDWKELNLHIVRDFSYTYKYK